MSVDVFLAALFALSIVVAIVVVLSSKRKKVDDELSPWLDETLGLDVDDD